MRKILIALGVLIPLIASLIGVILASGQIATNSLPIILNTLFGLSGPAATDVSVRQRYQVPDGFTLQLYAGELPRARFLRFTAAGDVLVSRPDMGADPLAGQREPIPPAHNFRPHNAPLGMTFLNADTLPPQYRHSALAALHGFCNRSSAEGYTVVSLHWTEDGIEERDFLAGFNQDGDISGRPVDVAQGPDGALYISDDYAGAIYRVAYREASANQTGQSSVTPMVVAAVNRLDATPPVGGILVMAAGAGAVRTGPTGG